MLVVVAIVVVVVVVVAAVVTAVVKHIIQMCSGITCGRVLNGELYAQRCQKLIYLHFLLTVS